MKRQFRIIFSLALAVLMLVPLALSVFADAAGPTNEPYEVVVNPGGTVAENGEFIPEGTVLTIYWEFKQPDGIFGFTEWNGNNIQINLADVTNGDVIPEEKGEKQSESTFEVFGENAVDVYAGPGYAYNVLFSIPAGERISGSYYMADWIYVRYGDQGGWIFPRYNGLVLYYEDPVTVWVVGETDFLKYQNIFPPREEDILCKIPTDTKLESHYRDINSGFYYVTYEGESGWVYSHRENVSAEVKDHYEANADMTLYLYDLPFDITSEEKEPESTLEVKKGEPYVMKFFVMGCKYDGVDWIYIVTEDGEGWTPSLYEGGYYEGDEEKELINKYPFVSELLENSTGITEEEYEAKLAEQDDVPDHDKPDEKEDITEKQDDKNETEDEEPDGFFSSPTAIIVSCAVAACILVLVAIVMLIIIKKKKGN